ncbi:MAG: HAD family hydrolase [Bacilli bacterium]|nr:HAD family hydrolase [Bacilli bacterium]
MIKGIMFDMGGTLVEWDYLGIPADVLYDHIVDKSINRDEFMAFVERLVEETLNQRTTFEAPFSSFIDAILKYYHTKLDISMDEMEILYQENLFKFRPIKGIFDVLEECKKEGLKMIVLSNTFFSSKALCKVLEEQGLLKYFDKVLASADYLVRKPSPIFFEMGLHEINLNKNEVLYIGDSYKYDVTGCLLAGIPMLYYHHWDDKKYELFESIKEIKEYDELKGVEICKIF